MIKIEMTKEEIDRAIEKGENLGDIYINEKLTERQIDKAIEKGKHLDTLYIHQKLTERQIDKAIEKGKHLDTLFMSQKFTRSQIDRILEKEKDKYILKNLVWWQNLSKRQIDKAIEIGIKTKNRNILELIINKHILMKRQIDKMMEIGIKMNLLGAIYNRQKLSKRQIDKAIEIGKNLDVLIKEQILTEKQIDRVLKKIAFLGNLTHQQLSSRQIQYVLEIICKSLGNLAYTQKLPKKKKKIIIEFLSKMESD